MIAPMDPRNYGPPFSAPIAEAAPAPRLVLVNDEHQATLVSITFDPVHSDRLTVELHFDGSVASIVDCVWHRGRVLIEWPYARFRWRGAVGDCKIRSGPWGVDLSLTFLENPDAPLTP